MADVGQSATTYTRPPGTRVVRALFWPFGFLNLALLVVSIAIPFEFLLKVAVLILVVALIVFAYCLEARTKVKFENATIGVGNAFSNIIVNANDVGMVYCGRISNGQLGPSLPGLILALRNGEIIPVQCSVGNSTKNRRSIHDDALAWAHRNHVPVSLPELGRLATWKSTHGL